MNVKAFTLVELLVVVTIIAVLLALLTPAFDQAMYQAELAVCGAKLKALGSGVTVYALDFKRAYPVRPALRRVEERPVYLVHSRNNATTYIDDREIIGNHIPIDLLLCPLDGKIAIGIGDTAPQSVVWSNYALWYGWGYTGEKGMYRMGNRFQWEGGRYSLLASDWDCKLDTTNNMANTHCDTDDLMEQAVTQNTNAAWAAGVGNGTNPTLKTTASYWRGTSRGPVDNNYAYDDNSVRRIDRSEFDRDLRLTTIPFTWDPATTPERKNFVPKE